MRRSPASAQLLCTLMLPGPGLHCTDVCLLLWLAVFVIQGPILQTNHKTPPGSVAPRSAGEAAPARRCRADDMRLLVSPPLQAESATHSLRLQLGNGQLLQRRRRGAG